MTKYGSQFSATDLLKKADGITHNARKRSFANCFDLAVDGGGSEALKVAEIPAGCRVESILIDTDANLSGQTFKWGTASDDVKYGAAVAGPNATQQLRYPKLSLKLDATTAKEDILLTPNGNIAASGTLRVTVNVTSR